MPSEQMQLSLDMVMNRSVVSASHASEAASGSGEGVDRGRLRRRLHVRLGVRQPATMSGASLAAR